MTEKIEYTETAEKIKNLPWDTYAPKKIIVAQFVIATELVGTLKKALLSYPELDFLKKLEQTHLNTKGLAYGDYNKPGNTNDFLAHFLSNDDEFNLLARDYYDNDCGKYLSTVRNFSAREAAITLFSRETELHEIYQTILQAHNWKELGFGFFEYFLQSQVNHSASIAKKGDIYDSIVNSEETLSIFYELLLNAYLAQK